MNSPRKKEVLVKKQVDSVDFLTDSDNKALPYFQVVLLICVIILTFPSLIIDASSNIDLSWFIGLHKATNEGLIYGRDIVFTYGPLGFLTVPVFVNKNLWAYSAVYTLAVYALTLFGCSLYLRKMKANLVKTVIFAVIFVVVCGGLFPGRDFELLLSVFIFSYLYTLGKRGLILLLGLAFLYSILPFIKFSAALAGGIVGVAFLCVLIRDKRGKKAVIFLIAYLAAFITLGLLLFRSPKAILMYLYGCWQITSGYNDAMGVNGSKTDLLFVVFAWILYIGLFCYCAFKKKRQDLIYLALGFGVLFLSFKTGFVRQDLHVFYFYSMWLSVFGLYFLRPFADAKIIGYTVLLFIFAMLYQGGMEIFSFQNPYTYNSVANKLRNLRLSFNLFRGIGAEERMAMAKTQLSSFYNLKTETVRMLSGHTMDVFPYDIAITEVYGFKWHPRPVFQSYSAYTEYLDLLNAKHFSSDAGPQYILYALGTIDKRYAIFDEPATFRTLLQEYKPCAQDGAFLVLEKNPPAGAGTEEYISTEATGFGQTIPLPRLDNELLFAKVHVEYNLLGLGRKFLFKPPNVYIAFFNERLLIGGRPWRLVFPNATNGLFISQYVADQNDLLEIWKGDTRQDITGIVLLTEHPAFFKDKITVQFFKMPIKK